MNNNKMKRPETSFKRREEDDLRKVSFSSISEYMDLLYEDNYEKKIRGARSILFLMTEPANMCNLLDQESLIELLSRTLREEYKKNMELSIYLLCVFFSYSSYAEFHPILSEFMIGDTCVKIVEFQLAKYIIRKQELVNKEASLKSTSPKDYEKELSRFFFMVKKQDRILRICFNILINLAEEVKIEKKMVKRDIVSLLVRNLDRSNINLIVIILLFLKKLSIYDVNKNQMIKMNIINEFNRLFEINHELIFQLTLRNIFNLSFDPVFRRVLCDRKDFFDKIVKFFKIPRFRGLVLRILYNISLEEKAKPLFVDTECLYILYELLIKFPEPIIGIELAALTLNLTTYPQNAQILATGEKVQELLNRAFKNNDFHLIKIVKNIAKYSEDDSINSTFEHFIDDFIKIIHTKNDAEDFLKEIVEILANVECQSWEEKIKKYDLILFFEKFLRDEKTYDELLLQIILFLGNIASNKRCSTLISNSKILDLLLTNFEKKINNYSIVFSIIYTLYQFIAWEDTRKKILSMDNLINLVLKCLKCENNRIIFVSLNFLEIVQLFEPKWSEKIKKKKFKIFNKDFVLYIKTIEKEVALQYAGYDEDADQDYENEEEYELD